MRLNNYVACISTDSDTCKFNTHSGEHTSLSPEVSYNVTLAPSTLQLKGLFAVIWRPLPAAGFKSLRAGVRDYPFKHEGLQGERFCGI